MSTKSLVERMQNPAFSKPNTLKMHDHIFAQDGSLFVHRMQDKML